MKETYGKWGVIVVYSDCGVVIMGFGETGTTDYLLDITPFIYQKFEECFDCYNIIVVKWNNFRHFKCIQGILEVTRTL